jgi:CrcB protein
MDGGVLRMVAQKLLFQQALLIGLGGMAGVYLRWGSAFLFGSGSTLFVNLVGSFVIGVVAGFSERPWYLGVTVGLLGGFTTYSAFILELMKRLQIDGVSASIGYGLLSVLGGCGAFLLGQSILKYFY